MQPKLDHVHHSEPDMNCNKLYAARSQAQWHDASSRDKVMEGKLSSFMPTFADYHLGTQTGKSQAMAVAAALREKEEATKEKGPLISFLGILN